MHTCVVLWIRGRAGNENVVKKNCADERNNYRPGECRDTSYKLITILIRSVDT